MVRGTSPVQRGAYKYPVSVASANDLDLSKKKGTYYKVTGTTTINGIKKDGVVAGTEILLEFAGICTVTHNGSPSTGYSKIYLAAAANVSTAATTMLYLVYDGTAFREAGVTTATYTGGVTPGTVTASKAVVVDSNKDISAFRYLTTAGLEGGVVVNEQGADVDFRLETDNTANMIVVDGALNSIGAISVGAAVPTNPQALLAVLPPANATGVTANQSYNHVTVLPGGATVVPAGTAPIVTSLNVAEPNITATGTVTDAATVRIADAPTEGTNNYALWVDSGQIREDAVTHQWGGIPGAATSQTTLYGKKTAIADNTATDIITVTVPNVNASAAIKIDLVAALGTGTDTFESTRYAEGCVVIARQAGANVVAATATLALAQIATVSGGGTITLAYDLGAVSGAVGATNTFTIRVTIVKTGTITDLQCMFVARLINAETGGVTMAAA